MPENVLAGQKANLVVRLLAGPGAISLDAVLGRRRAHGPGA
jgi:hypothetical protein